MVSCTTGVFQNTEVHHREGYNVGEFGVLAEWHITTFEGTVLFCVFDFSSPCPKDATCSHEYRSCLPAGDQEYRPEKLKGLFTLETCHMTTPPGDP